MFARPAIHSHRDVDGPLAAALVVHKLIIPCLVELSVHADQPPVKAPVPYDTRNYLVAVTCVVAKAMTIRVVEISRIVNNVNVGMPHTRERCFQLVIVELGMAPT